jgi:hypothetical protein
VKYKVQSHCLINNVNIVAMRFSSIMRSLFVGGDVSKFYDLVRPTLSEGVVNAVIDYTNEKVHLFRQYLMLQLCSTR